MINKENLLTISYISTRPYQFCLVEECDTDIRIYCQHEPTIKKEFTCDYKNNISRAIQYMLAER